MKTTVVFVHGYSVTNLNTYGELPIRLKAEAQQRGTDIDVKEIYLGKYISFHDEVCLKDISNAFESAVKEQLDESERFVCITHSTGGPVIREWWGKFYKKSKPPLSHLIMLAPPNFGSPLARLGKSRLSRIKTWFEGVEPGQGVLNWLECGSKESWDLNKEWIQSNGSQIGPDGFFPFVLTGQSIDRKLYDQLNSYTGELGSDGVVRTSSANLNSTYIKLVQKEIIDENIFTLSMDLKGTELEVSKYKVSPVIPLRVIKGKSHSGEEMGIMRSVKGDLNDKNSKETVNAIMDCIMVKSLAEYTTLIQKFSDETHKVQEKELLEKETELLVFTRKFFHDKFSQIIFKVVDSLRNPVKDYDLTFTAGDQNDANHFPPGFVIDRQQNQIDKETITYYFNYDVIKGAEKRKFRPELKGIKSMGLIVNPRPSEGFVRFVPCEIKANSDLLKKVFKPNSTTLIEIEIQRVVSKEVFRLKKLIGDKMPSEKEGDFKNAKPGSEIIKD